MNCANFCHHHYSLIVIREYRNANCLLELENTGRFLGLWLPLGTRVIEGSHEGPMKTGHAEKLEAAVRKRKRWIKLARFVGGSSLYFTWRRFGSQMKVVYPFD